MLKRIEISENIEEIDYSKFIITSDNINKSVNDFLSGKIERGFTIGIDVLDNHFVFKKNEFYVLTAKKGVGKTTITQALQIMGSIKNGLIWVVCFKENSEWSMKLNYMSYLLGEYAVNVAKSNKELYDLASIWVDEHFIFIDVDDIKTALDVTKFLIGSGKNIHAVVLDPVNSFRNGFQESGNGYSDGVLSAIEILKFTKKYCSVHISQHPTMVNQRKDGDITSYDAEGGWFLNKASFTYVINRTKGTSENRINVENVRNKLTGGSETQSENQIILEWSPNRINIVYENGFNRQENAIQILMRKYNPLGIINEVDVSLPNLTTDEAFKDAPF